MKKKLSMALSAISAAILSASPASAILNVPVPANAYINFGGLQWAWAGPCNAIDPSCGAVDLSFQSSLGWRLPTLAEIANAPSAMDFLFSGANVPLGGIDPISGATFFFTEATLNNDGAVATPYFSDFYLHADWCNAPGSACSVGELPWSPSASADFFSEALVVRNAGAVPEPGTWAMMLLGFGMAGFGLRNRRKPTVRVTYA